MDCRKLLAAGLLLGILFFGQVMCYPNGAPDSACSNMTPNHGVDDNKTLPPYAIRVSKSTYRPYEEITVTLQANSGVNFKGFLIQPRKITNITQAVTVGKLFGQSTKNFCTGLASLTHTNSSLKTSLSVIWQAPAVAVETVVFLTTFVQTKTIYWVSIKSRELVPDLGVPFTNSSGVGGGGVTTASSGSGSNITTASSGDGEVVTRSYKGGVSTVSYGASLTYSLIWILLLV